MVGGSLVEGQVDRRGSTAWALPALVLVLDSLDSGTAWPSVGRVVLVLDDGLDGAGRGDLRLLLATALLFVLVRRVALVFIPTSGGA